MLYESDFTSQYLNNNPVYIIKRNAFSVILNSNGIENRRKHANSVADASKPLSYFSSLFAMSFVRYGKNGFKAANTVLNKIYCLFVIAIYVTAIALVRPITFRSTDGDLPLTILAKTFTTSQSIEIVYDIFVIAFGNNVLYIKLFETLDSVDGHFIHSKKLFTKRRIFSTVLMFIPIILVNLTFLFRNFQIISLLTYGTFLLVTLQGVNCIFFLIIVYVQLLNFNTILLKKTGNMYSYKKVVFDDDRMAKIIKNMFNDSCAAHFHKNYCWFELMQIYDKIADSIYFYNQIYANQIFLMFNSWLLSTILAICRSLSPILKKSDKTRTDLFYYIFINLRPLCVTKMSEFLIQERQKTLTILFHNLIHKDLDQEYRKQINTMIALVKTRNLSLSANVCPVTVPFMIAFAGRVISYTVLMIQHFYIHN